MARNGEPMVSVRNVSFSYGYEKVLSDIDLDIYPDDYLAIIGPNGGGKTTLLKIILGLLKPAHGEVSWQCGDHRPRIGYVAQFATFERGFPLRVRDAVLMGRLDGSLWKQKVTQQDREMTQDILEKMGLSGLAHQPVSHLSGGQLQRAMIARALVMNPDILFLDEPIASIDTDSRFRLSSILKELNKKIPVVVVTHDITAFAADVEHIACVNRTLFYHGDGELVDGYLEEAYGCPVELVAHGVPHRVLQDHSQHQCLHQRQQDD